MTARRRRRSGSGPSATAMIAWAGGARIIADHAANSALSAAQPSVATLVGDRSGVLSGRLRGFAAGSLLACGSVLAVAVHAGDVALAPGEPDAAPEHRSPGTAPPAQPDATIATVSAPAPVPVPVHQAAAPPAGAVQPAGAGLGGSDAVPRNPVSSADAPATSRPSQAGGWERPTSPQAPTEAAPGGGPIRGALAPVAGASDRALGVVRQVAAPVAAPVAGAVTAPVTDPARHSARGGPVQQLGAATQQLGATAQEVGATAQRLGATAQRTTAALEEAGQPAMSMLPGSGLFPDAGPAADGGPVTATPAR